MTPYLYRFPNRHAPVRDNGIKFWGYPTRGGTPITCIGVHTTESAFDLIGEDTGAEGVARFQSETDRPSSYHSITDRDSTVRTLPDEAVAFGIKGLNAGALHLAFALRAVDWADPAKARAAQPALDLAARQVADWCREHRIPARRITREQARRGVRGLVAHGDMDPDRRSDPGADFPWQAFLAHVQTLLSPGPDLEELDVDEKTLRRIIGEEVDKRVALILRGGPTHPDSLASIRDDLAAIDVPRTVDRKARR